jgi:hypothetical protein
MRSTLTMAGLAIVDQMKEEPSNKVMIMTVKKETIKQEVIDPEYSDDANDSRHVLVEQDVYRN